jgi:putative addiction module CopG family antidote
VKRISKTRNISIQPDLDRFVEGMVQSGDFANYSEVIRHAVREMRQVHEERRARLESSDAFRASIKSAAQRQVRSFDLRKIAGR